MDSGPKKGSSPDKSRVLGGRVFAAITAVERLKMSPAAKRRLASMDSRKLTADERRNEIIRAYMDPKSR